MINYFSKQRITNFKVNNYEHNFYIAEFNMIFNSIVFYFTDFRIDNRNKIINLESKKEFIKKNIY